MAFGVAATAAAHAWADSNGDDAMDYDMPPVFRGSMRSADVHTAAAAHHATGCTWRVRADADS